MIDRAQVYRRGDDPERPEYRLLTDDFDIEPHELSIMRVNGDFYVSVVEAGRRMSMVGVRVRTSGQRHHAVSVAVAHLFRQLELAAELEALQGKQSEDHGESP